MKKIIWVVIASFTTQAMAQSAPSPEPPQPIDPVLSQPATQAQSESIVQADPNQIPTTLRVDPISFNARLGVGTSLSPSGLWMTADAEVQVDKFLALGPKLQYGNNSSTDYILGSVGPRFTVPFSFFEMGFQGGLGFTYRNAAGFQFTNFLYQAGWNMDVYLLKNLSVGVGYTANFMSSQADSFISALVISGSGHF